MDRCKHVGRLRLAPDHSILNPQKWHCNTCNTTESVWACLGCAHVACGRYLEEHALQHFRLQRHPLAMEVNSLYVFCYLCDDYVLNDNTTGDLRLLRGTLSCIQSQRYEVTTRSGRTLRSAASAPGPPSAPGGPDALLLPPPCTGARELQLRDEDRMFTALWHRRRVLMGRVFRGWFGQTEGGRRRGEEERREEEEEEKREEAREKRRSGKRRAREELESAPPRKSGRLRKMSRKAAAAAAVSPSPPRPPTRTPPPPPSSKQANSSSSSPLKRRPTVTPGVTGLRNLGNTCYMNSILQVLSHLHVFRECFLRLDLTQALGLLVHGGLVVPVSPSPPQTSSSSSRARAGGGVGLSGGGVSRARSSMELIQPKEPSSKHLSLCHELHTLFQVMWSGKWALVSPFAMLNSVWQLIPAFRGYAQQDAQEFLCQLLDKVQRELEATPTTPAPLGGGGPAPEEAGGHAPPCPRPPHHPGWGPAPEEAGAAGAGHRQHHLPRTAAEPACDHRSNTVEPFWDLSLEFPERYHSSSSRSEVAAQASCRVTEMLAKFTETEALEGSIYACDQCNSKRRRFSSKPVILTEAQKQLMVHKLPQVLRLHLKRFRWSGRNHREKIRVHVSFDQLLNMEPYCCRGPSPKGSPCSGPAPSGSPCPPQRFLYELSAVVMHHGKGFGSGHYTAYCYNKEGGFWVHCNDSKLNVCSVEEVCRAQAYILFYTQCHTQDRDHPL